ncbi:hypothetical protein [Sphingobacterium sp. UDSM-2020]|uniref:hypothetical protein n=1 Tax=Sphingobacterium sp. UDSM-2020 TaxID=2795738 RepID=UPI001936B03B|nr:hypothetical protein [Sphingobacterium sp. UDSM-2020]QQD14402.1 hypothetical protein JAZ75_02320 [Sphingobacterium sp. UDSM-2020]
MMVLALVIGVATMSFKMASSSQVFHYTDTADPGNFANPANWEPGGVTGGCTPGETYPCEITVEDQQDLITQLDGKDNEDVLIMADNTRD